MPNNVTIPTALTSGQATFITKVDGYNWYYDPTTKTISQVTPADIAAHPEIPNYSPASSNDRSFFGQGTGAWTQFAGITNNGLPANYSNATTVAPTTPATPAAATPAVTTPTPTPTPVAPVTTPTAPATPVTPTPAPTPTTTQFQAVLNSNPVAGGAYNLYGADGKYGGQASAASLSQYGLSTTNLGNVGVAMTGTPPYADAPAKAASPTPAATPVSTPVATTTPTPATPTVTPATATTPLTVSNIPTTPATTPAAATTPVTAPTTTPTTPVTATPTVATPPSTTYNNPTGTASFQKPNQGLSWGLPVDGQIYLPTGGPPYSNLYMRQGNSIVSIGLGALGSEAYLQQNPTATNLAGVNGNTLVQLGIQAFQKQTGLDVNSLPQYNVGDVTNNTGLTNSTTTPQIANIAALNSVTAAATAKQPSVSTTPEVITSSTAANNPNAAQITSNTQGALVTPNSATTNLEAAGATAAQAQAIAANQTSTNGGLGSAVTPTGVAAANLPTATPVPTTPVVPTVTPTTSTPSTTGAALPAAPVGTTTSAGTAPFASTSTATPTPTVPTTAAPIDYSQGLSSSQVQQVQDFLVKQGYLTQAQVNTGYGTYGPQTTAAVSAWQKANGVTTDPTQLGYWGPKSIAAATTQGLSTSSASTPDFGAIGNNATLTVPSGGITGNTGSSTLTTALGVNTNPTSTTTPIQTTSAGSTTPVTASTTQTPVVPNTSTNSSTLNLTPSTSTGAGLSSNVAANPAVVAQTNTPAVPANTLNLTPTQANGSQPIPGTSSTTTPLSNIDSSTLNFPTTPAVGANTLGLTTSQVAGTSTIPGTTSNTTPAATNTTATTPATTGTTSTNQSTTGLTTTPTNTSTTPVVPQLSDLEQAVENNMQETDAEKANDAAILAEQGKLAGFTTAAQQGQLNVQGQPIATPFITGQSAAIAKQAALNQGVESNVITSLQAKAALLQAQRQTALDVSQFALSRADAAASAAATAAKSRYVTLGDGATLYDTQTGQVVASNPKTYAPSSTTMTANQLTQSINEAIQTAINNGETPDQIAVDIRSVGGNPSDYGYSN